jgi:hypothetical protein
MSNDLDNILEDGVNSTFEFESQASKLVAETPSQPEKYQGFLFLNLIF